jgi:hypothetical protein
MPAIGLGVNTTRHGEEIKMPGAVPLPLVVVNVERMKPCSSSSGQGDLAECLGTIGLSDTGLAAERRSHQGGKHQFATGKLRHRVEVELHPKSSGTRGPHVRKATFCRSLQKKGATPLFSGCPAIEYIVRVGPMSHVSPIIS